jgi:Ca2+-binding RTX toxin-like protein
MQIISASQNSFVASAEYADVILILPGVNVIYNVPGAALDIDHGEVRVTNYGSLFGAWYGADLGGSNGSLTNASGARIFGANAGIVIYASGAFVHNLGEVIGGAVGVFAGFGQDYAHIVNGPDALIAGEEGVRTLGNYASVTNSGAIEGGVWLSGEGSSLLNTGTVSGDVVLAVGEAIVRNSGSITGDVMLGDGNDRFLGALGTVLGTVDGGAGNDLIVIGSGETAHGGSGVDTIRGRGAEDVLVGGLGADLLSGGLGQDTFVYERVNDTKVAAADRIWAFDQLAQDRIDLSAIDANTRLAGNQEFRFIGGGAFNGVAGQLHVVASGANLFVEGDVNGDAVADFRIILSSLGAQAASFTADEFVL